jgi:hypothetical protein
MTTFRAIPKPGVYECEQNGLSVRIKGPEHELHADTFGRLFQRVPSDYTPPQPGAVGGKAYLIAALKKERDAYSRNTGNWISISYCIDLAEFILTDAPAVSPEAKLPPEVQELSLNEQTIRADEREKCEMELRIEYQEQLGRALGYPSDRNIPDWLNLLQQIPNEQTIRRDQDERTRAEIAGKAREIEARYGRPCNNWKAAWIDLTNLLNVDPAESLARAACERAGLEYLRLEPAPREQHCIHFRRNGDAMQVWLRTDRIHAPEAYDNVLREWAVKA